MGRIITFHVTCLGASHVKKGKPCQDYSLSWQSEDKTTHVAIVCDGHGGDTYVRSDRGARLAAEIALRCIRNMVDCVSPDSFLDKEGAVTARPEEEDDIFHPLKETYSKPLPDNADEEDCRVQQARQDRCFYAAVAPIREQDQLMQRLFAAIYIQWLDAIEQDAQNDPFTDQEKAQLGSARLAKAYGTTLMAFVRTPLYWFAFHIGDGRMLCCDTNFRWREPVPWDCNCFLNMTTSLCAKEPLHSFRYAFNGKGEFPAAVIMGSDGLDDSWCTMENLTNFYSQTLSIFNELKEEKTIKEMKEYLPRLSEKGSRDDMSMAGSIDMNAIAAGTAVYQKQRELNALLGECKKQEERIGQLQQSQTDVSEAEKTLQEAKATYQDWQQGAKAKKAILEADYKQLLAVGNQYETEEKLLWERCKEAYLAAREASRKQKMSERIASMMEHDEEAAKSIREAKFEPEDKSDKE